MTTRLVVPLGTHISYTHRAAIARKGGKNQWVRGWMLPAKGNGEVPSLEEREGKLYVGRTPDLARQAMFIDSEGRDVTDVGLERWNKAVACWPEKGAGVVTGLVIKQNGISEGPRGGTGEDDWEPGYFTSFGNVELYVVRWELRGRAFGHVPVWAAQV